jgi:hypothetical protein
VLILSVLTLTGLITRYASTFTLEPPSATGQTSLSLHQLILQLPLASSPAIVKRRNVRLFLPMFSIFVNVIAVMQVAEAVVNLGDGGRGSVWGWGLFTLFAKACDVFLATILTLGGPLSKRKVWSAVGLGLLVGTMHSIVSTLATNVPCSACSVHAPSAYTWVVYIPTGLAMIAGGVYRWRQPARLWAPSAWLFAIGGAYLLAATATLWSFLHPHADGPFCLLMIAVTIYTVCYAPFTFFALVQETRRADHRETPTPSFSSSIQHTERSPLLSPTVTPDSSNDQDVRVPAEPPTPQVTVIPTQDLGISSTIGSGPYSKVFAGTWGPKAVAIKQILDAFTTRASSQTAITEVATLVSVPEHPNIVPLLGIALDESTSFLALITPLAAGGSLFRAIHSVKLKPSLPRALRVTTDALTGLAFLHSLQVLHRDLKSPNLLLSGPLDALGTRVMLCDFGLSKLIASVSTHTGAIGTPAWMAPEVLTGQHYGLPSDMYSMGVVLWELLQLRVPFEGVPAVTIIGRRVAGTANLEMPKNLPAALHSLLASLLATEPTARPTAPDALDRLRIMVGEKPADSQGKGSS